MSTQSINIRICGRAYPMRITSTGEAVLRAAGRTLNEQIAAYQKQFPAADYQDVLAMVAFDAIAQQQVPREHPDQATLASLTQRIQETLASTS